MVLRLMGKEEKMTVKHNKKYNKVVERYNRAVEIGSKEHHQLAVELSKAHAQMITKSYLNEHINKNRREILKNMFKILSRKIKKRRVLKMFNQQKFERLTKDQQERVNKAAKEFQEAQEANASCRRVNGPSKEISERFHKATKEYAEILGIYGLTRP